MKKLILISLLILSSTLFAETNIGVRIQTPIGNNGLLDVGFRSDDHRYDNRYKNFDYRRSSYYDNYGYFYGYFDRNGYFYNNIYFSYDNRYTYYDRLHHRGYFKPNKAHYRTYQYHKHNNWNRTRQYREPNRAIYGPYYDKKYDKKKVIVEHHYGKNDRHEKNYRDYSNKQEHKIRRNDNNYKENNYKNHKDYNKHNR